jgi:hypothetical protein
MLMPVTDPRAPVGARELAAVRPLAVPAQHDLVVGRDHVVDGDSYIGESRAIQVHRALEHLGSAEGAQLGWLGGVVVDASDAISLDSW